MPFTLAVVPLITTALARSSAVSIVVVVVMGLIAGGVPPASVAAATVGGDGELEVEDGATIELDSECGGGEEVIVTAEAVDGLDEAKLVRCAANRVAILEAGATALCGWFMGPGQGAS